MFLDCVRVGLLHEKTHLYTGRTQVEHTGTEKPQLSFEPRIFLFSANQLVQIKSPHISWIYW